MRVKNETEVTQSCLTLSDSMDCSPPGSSVHGIFRATHSNILGLPGSSAGKESPCNAGDLGSIPELGRFPGEGKDYPLQDSGLEKPMGLQRVRHD